MPCATTTGKRKKPPKAWFDKMYAEVKAGNPEYSDEQVRATVGAIWYRNLSPGQKAKAKSMESDLMKTLSEIQGNLEKGIFGLARRVGYEKPGHKYFKRVPKVGGGYAYYYTKQDWLAGRARSAPPAQSGVTGKATGVPPGYKEIKQFAVQLKAKGLDMATVKKKLVDKGYSRGLVDAAIRAVYNVGGGPPIWGYRAPIWSSARKAVETEGMKLLKRVTADLEKATVGYVKPGHKYYKRVPKGGGGYTYYYTKEDWQAKRGKPAPPAKPVAGKAEDELTEREKDLRQTAGSLDTEFGVKLSQKDLGEFHDYMMDKNPDSEQWHDVAEEWLEKRGHLGESAKKPGKPSLDKWLSQWKENEDRIDTLKGEIKLLATHNRKLYDTIKPQMEKLPGMVYETNSLIAQFTKSEELSARPSYKEAFQTALNKVNGRTRELLVRLLDETKKLLKKEELTVVRKSVGASDNGDTVQSLLNKLVTVMTEGNQELRNILLQAKKEAGNMGLENTQKALGALIDMDPLRAAQEGDSPLEMLKNVNSELRKGLSTGPDQTGDRTEERSLTSPEASTGLDMLKAITSDLTKAKKPKKCSHVNPDGTFKGGFDGCMAHQQSCKGLAEENARRLCAWIGRKHGKIPGGLKKSFTPARIAEIVGPAASDQEMSEHDMVKAMDAALEKAITEGPKGVSFEIKGEKIQAGIANKVAELNQKVTKLIARHPNCDLDDESKDYPEVVKTGSDTMENVPEMSGSQCPNRQEHWQIRDHRRTIDRLRRVSRNLDPKKTFSLSHWDLEEYGL